MKIAIDTKALAKCKAVLSKHPQMLNAALQNAMITLAEDVRRVAVTKLRDSGAVDTGLLMNSIVVVPEGKHTMIVGTNVAYAAAVEYGAKGHWIHIDSIPGFRVWLKRHGIPGWDTRKFFYVEPTPKPYFEPAFEHGKALAPKVVEMALDNMLAGISQ